ncbi:MAG: nucleotidyltransferase family protein [Planctomycetes bacterium]|nr:nucleotidyltransferase family protein [Planctomycetota bacterium]NUQ34606.1 nucleotidyltransferase family protein [Planctomycetaceae bacterium]
MVDLVQRLHVTPEQIADFCRRHSIVRLSLFGSVVRGDFRPDSDVDVLVKFDDAAQLTLLDLVHIRDKLAALLARPVDLIEEGTIENPFRKKSIARDQQVVYAA